MSTAQVSEKINSVGRWSGGGVEVVEEAVILARSLTKFREVVTIPLMPSIRTQVWSARAMAGVTFLLLVAACGAPQEGSGGSDGGPPPPSPSTCGGSGDSAACPSGMQCCYPCGVQGCDWVCASPEQCESWSTLPSTATPGESPPPPSPSPPPEQFSSEQRSCQHDQDCVATLFDGCCGSCECREPYAVNRNALEAEEAECVAVDCAPLADCVPCPNRFMDVDAVPTLCRDGQCSIEAPTSDSPN